MSDFNPEDLPAGWLARCSVTRALEPEPSTDPPPPGLAPLAGFEAEDLAGAFPPGDAVPPLDEVLLRSDSWQAWSFATLRDGQIWAFPRLGEADIEGSPFLADVARRFAVQIAVNERHASRHRAYSPAALDDACSCLASLLALARAAGLALLGMNYRISDADALALLPRGDGPGDTAFSQAVLLCFAGLLPDRSELTEAEIDAQSP